MSDNTWRKIWAVLIIAIAISAFWLLVSHSIAEDERRDKCQAFCEPLEYRIKGAEIGGDSKRTCLCLTPGKEVTLEELYEK